MPSSGITAVRRRRVLRGTVAERLAAGLVPDEASGCLLWTGGLNHDGYGVMRVGSQIRKVHRVVWELEVGPIPDGLTLDHVEARGCVHRHCANVAHLEPVTNGVRNCRACRRRRKKAYVARLRLRQQADSRAMAAEWAAVVAGRRSA